MIYIVTGLPRKGKTYYAVLLTIRMLLSGKKVFTNFPVTYYKPLSVYQNFINLIYTLRKKEKPYIKERYSSFVWERRFMYTVMDAEIFIDEGHRDFPRGTMKLSQDEENFFTEHGQNNLNIYLVSQRASGINNVIRDIANYFIQVRSYTYSWVKKDTKGKRPFSKAYIDTYNEEKDIGLYKKSKKEHLRDKRIKKESIGFDKNIGKAYNTLFYRHEHIQEPQYTTWHDFIEGIDRYVPSQNAKEESKEKEIAEEIKEDIV